MFDFITDPLNTIATWFGYGVLFAMVMTAIFAIAIVSVFPFAMKLFAIHLAKTIIIEGSKVASNLGIDKIAKNATVSSDQLKQLLIKANEKTKSLTK